MKILYGNSVSESILNELKLKIKNSNIFPKFAIIQVANIDSSNIYIKRKIEIANKTNIKVELYKFNEDISYIELKKQIEILNKDNSINGIIVQLPIPIHLTKILNEINYEKDIDGLTVHQSGNLFSNLDGLYPCTALGVMKLLEYYSIDLLSKKVAIIGRSNLVGKPLAMLMLKANAMVTIFHAKLNKNFLKEELVKYDIICSAVGQYGLIKPEFLKKDVVLIDIGCSKVGNLFLGDIDHACYEKAKCYTPVPGGIGPLTVAFLMYNVVKACCIQNKLNF